MKIKDMPKAVGDIDIKGEKVKAGAKWLAVKIFWITLLCIVVVFVIVSN